MDSFLELMSKMEVRTALPMNIAPTTYSPTFRLTACDIMCTTNTKVMIPEQKRSSAKDSPNAYIPYEKLNRIKGQALEGITPFQRLKIAEIKVKRNNDLKRERNEYFWKIMQEKERHNESCCKAAIRIQKHFRGYLLRLRRQRIRQIYTPKPKRVEVSLIGIHDELCGWADKVALKPILGLSLEPKHKTSKRKLKLEATAANTLTAFFKMIMERNKARRRMNEYHIKVANWAALVCTRFFRLVKIRTLAKNVNFQNRRMAALKIQCAVRRRQARKR